MSSSQPEPRSLRQAYAPLTGDVSLPGDKSITHRAFLFSLLARCPWRIEGWLDSADTRRSLEAFQTLGGRSEQVAGALLHTPPAGPPGGPDLRDINCGNSGTTARLLCGLLAGWLDPQGAAVRLHGDASLSSRPMARVVDPLRSLGADINYDGQPGRLPLVIRGAELSGGRHHLPVPSAQVKSALQLAGLFARGSVAVTGADNVRDHTDRLLPLVSREAAMLTLAVPADPSAAAFFLVAAALVPGSRLTVRNISLNPGRTGFLEVLRRAGAQVQIEPRKGGEPEPKSAEPKSPEPMGTVSVEHRPLQAFAITADEVPTLIDELPVLALLAAGAEGLSVIGGAADLRAKECDRIAATADLLECVGAQVQRRPDGWIIEGPTRWRGGTEQTPHRVRTHGDHRIAMTAAVAALVTPGVVTIDDPQCVSISFPDFFLTLDSLLG